MKPIIEIENLSKEYTLFHKLPYYTLRDMFTSVARKPLDILRGKIKSHEQEKFSALKDINFSIQQGERVGIIGRNGAGKSTLLKILSQITPPTTGEIILRGRVASLLEVGTGFHPELTGRENIYLNGAILGMKQKEIAKKFDEIVDFSEIEKFLDTPVKRYSSGMYVRLAFAVAAYLEPEILIVDEVLAVGDAQFQKKCLGKMEDVANQGRTILFVSHNMAAVSQLCTRVILLEDGIIRQSGRPEQVISSYLSQQLKSDPASIELRDPKIRKNSLSNSKLKWKKISLVNTKNEPTAIIGFQESFNILLELEANADAHETRIGFAIQSYLGFPVFNSLQIDSNLPQSFAPGVVIFTIQINPNFLAPGLYEISLGANGPGVIDWIPSAIQFSDTETGSSPDQRWENYRGGFAYYPYQWNVNTK